MSGLTPRDASALAHLVARLREEVHGANRWDEAGINAELARLVGQNLAITVDRVIRHACDTTAKTPGAIRRPFLPDAPTPGPRFPARAGEDCRLHPGEYPDGCRSCAADRLAGDQADQADQRPRPATDDTRAEAIRRARAALRPHPADHGTDTQEDQ